MDWLQRTFLHRGDYSPALQGLRGLAVLWFFQLSFYQQFDTTKLSRLTASKPWMPDLLDTVIRLIAPAIWTPALFYVLGGFLVMRALESRTLTDFLGARLRRFYPVFIVSALPILIYTRADWPKLAWAATFFILPQDFPVGYSLILARAFWLPLILASLHLLFKRSPKRDLLSTIAFLGLAALDLAVFRDLVNTAAFVSVLAGAVSARQVRFLLGSAARHLAGPCLLLAVILSSFLLEHSRGQGTSISLVVTVLTSLALAGLDANPRSFCARILASPFFRYYGAVALPFYLIHTTWGFRLSRSIVQGELHSVGDIAAHYILSLVFSTVFAGLLHVFFERPSFLRNAPSADKTSGSPIQGVSR